MDQNFTRTDLLPSTVPDLAVWLIMIFAVAGWVLVHYFVKTKMAKQKLWVRLSICSAIGTVASWTVLQCLGRYFFLAGYWHLFLTSIITGVSFELISFLYAHECARMKKKFARQLVPIRMASVGLLIFVLLQPILVGDNERVIKRRVVVFVDDSASMNFIDKQWSIEQRIDIASALGEIGGSDNPLSNFKNTVSSIKEKLDVHRALASVDNSGASIDREGLSTWIKETREYFVPKAEILSKLFTEIDAKAHPLLAESVRRISQYCSSLIIPSLDRVELDVRNKSMPKVVGGVIKLSKDLGDMLPALDAIERASDVVLYDKMTQEEKDRINSITEDTRFHIIKKLLQKDGDASYVSRLSKKYEVDIFRFGRTAEIDASYKGELLPKYAVDDNLKNSKKDSDASEESESLVESFKSATDISKAFEMMLNEVPSEEIAAIIIFTDGRFTNEVGIDSLCRKFGGQKIPVSSVVIGGSIAPYDISLSSANCPDSVFLGDKVRFNIVVAATQARGKMSKLTLYLGEEEIESRDIRIESDDWMQEFRFSHTPDRHGVLSYKVKVDGLEGEEFPDNNEWSLDVSVSDDRTNVLLIDDRPRWEFRYLRNLFYGRDKSVHLQEYLVTPDVLAGAPDKNLPPASADRKFGDSESSSLPRSLEEWKKFDVIIVGDVGEDILTPAVVNNIEYCVRERGALAVFIAGSEKMPHKIRNPKLQELLPIMYSPSNRDFLVPPEDEFLFSLTPSGRGHQVMNQSFSSAENEEIWNDLPTFAWRYPINGIKPGSEVLAYAKKVSQADDYAFAKDVAAEAQNDPQAAVKKLAELKSIQEKNALIVAQGQGRGRVLMLNTDQTWRLRYRVGDTRHHKFWGQVLRWGAGEKLRAGNTYVRLGTNQLRYSPDESIKVFARLVDMSYNPIDGVEPEVILKKGQADIAAITLKPREDSNGFFEGEFPAIDNPGVYTLFLRCPSAEKMLGSAFPKNLQTKFVVVTSKRPAEFVNITSSTVLPARMAMLSGGKVYSANEFVGMSDDFGEGNKVLHDRSEVNLWDNPLIFLIIIALLTYEWILRKKIGIA